MIFAFNALTMDSIFGKCEFVICGKETERSGLVSMPVRRRILLSGQFFQIWS